MSLPFISIITSSYNQGQFIERTIQSVLLQNYPFFEHIIVDNLSNDDTFNILKKYPHLKIIREPDTGQSHAINKGFSIAVGDILCFLNSDDTLMAGALYRVAKEINPTLNRQVVMGRCQFIDENDKPTGIEHPSYFTNYLRVLKIWKGHGIPQPAVFWTREVMTRCGSLNENEKYVLDYDLFCRFSRHYQFHRVDQVLATYRLHDQSKTNFLSDDVRLAESIKVSKRYWGPRYKIFYWRLWSSLVNFNRRNLSQFYLSNIKNNSLWTRRKKLFFMILASLIGPDILFYRLIHPFFKKLIYTHNAAYRQRLIQYYPQITAYVSFKGQWPDWWVGPHYIGTLPISVLSRRIRIKGELLFFNPPLHISIWINGYLVCRQVINQKGYFEIEFDRPDLSSLSHDEIQLICEEWSIMHDFTRNNDFRPLSWKFIGFELDGIN